MMKFDQKCADGVRLVLISSVWGAANPAQADDALTWSVAYTADVIAGSGDDVSTRGRFLDNLDVLADLDLDLGRTSATLHAHILNNSGKIPNDDLGRMLGVDNVASQHLRLFEFWVEQAFGGGGVRAGLHDLNCGFYSNESAGLLIAPGCACSRTLSSSCIPTETRTATSFFWGGGFAF